MMSIYAAKNSSFSYRRYGKAAALVTYDVKFQLPRAAVDTSEIDVLNKRM